MLTLYSHYQDRSASKYRNASTTWFLYLIVCFFRALSGVTTVENDLHYRFGIFSVTDAFPGKTLFYILTKPSISYKYLSIKMQKPGPLQYFITFHYPICDIVSYCTDLCIHYTYKYL